MKAVMMVVFLSIAVVTSLLAPVAENLNDQMVSAARKGDLRVVSALLEKGADVNAKTVHGVSALCFAAGNGHLETVKFLMERGADLNAKDPIYTADALQWAAYRDQILVVRFLLPKMPPDRSLGILNVGVQKGNLDLVKLALDRGGLSPDALSMALGDATREGAEGVAVLLRKAGAVPPPRGDLEVPGEILKSYAGHYRENSLGLELRLNLERGKLAGLFSSQGAFTLGAIDATTFRPLEVEGVTLTFELVDGKTVSCTWKNARRRTTLVFKKVDEK
ncbi:MAG: ankyrin repeat domain-containing protein [Gammaproteobacteria bacterium]